MAKDQIKTLLEAQQKIDTNVATEAGKTGTAVDGQVIDVTPDGTVTLDVAGGEVVGGAYAAGA